MWELTHVVADVIAQMNKQKQIQNVLQPNQEKVVAEKNKTIAKLDDGISGTCFISTKAKLPNDIQAMDQET